MNKETRKKKKTFVFCENKIKEATKERKIKIKICQAHQAWKEFFSLLHSTW